MQFGAGRGSDCTNTYRYAHEKCRGRSLPHLLVLCPVAVAIIMRLAFLHAADTAVVIGPLMHPITSTFTSADGFLSCQGLNRKTHNGLELQKEEDFDAAAGHEPPS